MRIGMYCQYAKDYVFEGNEETTWGGDIRVVFHPECAELQRLNTIQRNLAESHKTHIECNCDKKFKELSEQAQAIRTAHNLA